MELMYWTVIVSPEGTTVEFRCTEREMRDLMVDKRNSDMSILNTDGTIRIIDMSKVMSIAFREIKDL
jgi:hypothetical protein